MQQVEGVPGRRLVVLVVGYEAEGVCEFWNSARDTPSLSLHLAKGEATRGLHLAFEAQDRTAVDAFFRAALGAGGRERHAPRHWPEYRAYCAATHRWLPRLGNLPATLRDMRFDWRRVLVKDYSSCYTWVMTALALLYYEAAAGGPWHEPLRRVKWLVAAALCATAIFLVLRHLKKTKLLRAAA